MGAESSGPAYPPLSAGEPGLTRLTRPRCSRTPSSGGGVSLDPRP